MSLPLHLLSFFKSSFNIFTADKFVKAWRKLFEKKKKSEQSSLSTSTTNAIDHVDGIQSNDVESQDPVPVDDTPKSSAFDT